MGDTAQKWLMGCGIGCAVVILLGGMLFGGCYYCARHVTRGFDQASKTGDEIEARFGTVKSYTPPLDGVVPPARMEAFLAVRDSIATLRGGIEEAFASFARAKQMGRKKDFLTILGAVRGGVSMGPLTGEFYRKRNSALLAREMGLGEYTYIYCLSYFSFLGLKPEAAPPGLHTDDNDSGYGVRNRVHRRMLQMLSNLQAALDEPTGAGPAGAGAAKAGRKSAGSHGAAGKGGAASAPAGSFREALNDEMAAMLADDERVPWQDGLPAPFAAGLEPYRERLKSSYSVACNLFEFGTNIRTSRGGFRMETDSADSTE